VTKQSDNYLKKRRDCFAALAMTVSLNLAFSAVPYAVNLARHSANGWDDPALPYDYRMIGELLQQWPEFVRRSVEPDTRG
jgi:hypothetical protein